MPSITHFKLINHIKGAASCSVGIAGRTVVDVGQSFDGTLIQLGVNGTTLICVPPASWSGQCPSCMSEAISQQI